MKIAIVSVVPSPYQRDLFRALQRLEGIDLKVFYLEASAPDSPWPEKPLRSWESILPGKTLGSARVRCHFNWNIPDFHDSDMVVLNASLTDWTTQDLMRRLTRIKKPWVFWGECLRDRGGFAGAVQSKLVSPLAQAEAVLAIGKRAQADFQSRLPGLRCLELPYHCDITPFLEIERPTESPRAITFLFCGQMIERKGFDILLESFRQVRETHPEARLLVAGRGDSICEDGVDYRGFIAPEELPRLFAEADAFVLPSRHDGWGVVINQALAAGLPIIATDAVGAAADLVKSGREGFIIPPDDADALRDAMITLLDDPHLRQKQSLAARERGNQLDPAHGAERFARMLEGLLHAEHPALAS